MMMMMMMSNNGYTTQMRDHDEQEKLNGYSYEEENASGSGCFSFCFGRHPWSLLEGGEQKEETWLIKKTKEVREFSEVVAGPKWKNFIRKFGKFWNTKKSRMAECRQYDAQSYALNFDDGLLDDFEHDHDNSGFCTKFAPPAAVPTKLPSTTL